MWEIFLSDLSSSSRWQAAGGFENMDLGQKGQDRSLIMWKSINIEKA